MPANTFLYLGHYETSFHRLTADQDRYWTLNERGADDAGAALEQPPSKFDGGIRFGFMQVNDGHLIVRINKLLLPAPVLFIGERHGSRGPGPVWSEISPDATLNLLADAVVANPAFRDHLIGLACRQAQVQ
jgi:hypothetical protein